MGYHTANLLSSGQVLVAGGYDNASYLNAGYLASAELYNPATDTWTATDSLNPARRYHTATLLSGGQVLVAGGELNTGSLASAEISNATAGPGGAISPAGAQPVADGTDATFTITPDAGKRIMDVVVDGVSQGPGTSSPTSYTFTNVIADHTITATFNNSFDFVIWATAGANGTISPYGGVNAPI